MVAELSVQRLIPISAPRGLQVTLQVIDLQGFLLPGWLGGNVAPLSDRLSRTFMLSGTRDF